MMPVIPGKRDMAMRAFQGPPRMGSALMIERNRLRPIVIAAAIDDARSIAWALLGNSALNPLNPKSDRIINKYMRGVT